MAVFKQPTLRQHANYPKENAADRPHVLPQSDFRPFLVSDNTKGTTKEPRTRKYLQGLECEVLCWECVCAVCVCEMFVWLLVHVSTNFYDGCVCCVRCMAVFIGIGLDCLFVCFCSQHCRWGRSAAGGKSSSFGRQGHAFDSDKPWEGSSSARGRCNESRKCFFFLFFENLPQHRKTSLIV